MAPVAQATAMPAALIDWKSAIDASELEMATRLVDTAVTSRLERDDGILYHAEVSLRRKACVAVIKCGAVFSEARSLKPAADEDLGAILQR